MIVAFYMRNVALKGSISRLQWSFHDDYQDASCLSGYSSTKRKGPWKKWSVSSTISEGLQWKVFYWILICNVHLAVKENWALLSFPLYWRYWRCTVVGLEVLLLFFTLIFTSEELFPAWMDRIKYSSNQNICHYKK